MPKSWFFEIHEDTPEQEASNLMEHSAAVLDISSDDDVETKQRNEELERGKENVPPPDYALAQPRSPTTSTEELAVPEPHVKMPRLREVKQDAMDEDRKPLGDLPAEEFYGEGCDKHSYVTVDAGIERPSGLSKEFAFSCETPEEPKALAEVVKAVAVPEESEDPVAVYSDENAAPAISVYSDENATSAIAVYSDENAAPATSSSETHLETSEAL